MSRPSLDEARTKIVATVGPASDTVEKLVALIDAGVDIFRINTAHGSRQQHATVLGNIREASNQTGFHVAVLLDLAGPKLRMGQLLQEPLACGMGAKLTFIRGDQPKDPYEITSTYAKLIDELEVDDRIMLADGTVSLVAATVTEDRAVCRVVASGEIRSRQGINLPGVKLSVSAMLPRDIDNAIWAAEQGIDLISLSFVRSADDILQLRALLAKHQSSALVIAKIEKPEALEQLDAIVDATDGVMVARGDLGVEIDVAETPVAQKRIIRVCRRKNKPVIVATQMLESMHHSSRPTRAEASDVANAILDGTDACMLSGETAVGDHPAKAVAMMNRIMLCTEKELRHSIGDRSVTDRVHPITTAVTHAATNIAESIGAKLIVIATRSGSTAWVKSKSRSLVPTLGVSESPETLRRMNLLWGIKPIQATQMADTQEFIDEICRWGHANAQLNPGDQVVFVTGTGVVKQAHNLLLVHTVQ
ncbi:pyruvate kinase [Planctomycetes bacterium K23_9]|uniref:Pyruvate kinase n=1 Tax=Stieleria marina TaxID=1930275 RepID=A0A517NNQ9_9BACT|nr:Pyruvate kinase [Planctomycetes bacterium K23_9]